MKYEKRIVLKNGKELYIRNGEASDGAAVLECFNLTHAETDHLLSYPDENRFDAEAESHFLEEKAKSPNETELLALIEGRLAGTAGIDALGSYCKVKHRAEFGINVLKEYWGFGIGTVLTEACIECAKNAGYIQLELSVAADNARAISVYKKFGFVEYGRNPLGFNSRISGFQTLVLMRLEL